MTQSNSTVGVATCIADKVFPREFIDELNRFAERSAASGETGGVVRSDASLALDAHVRRSRVVWLAHSPQSAPIYDFISQFVLHANKQVFGFDLQGFEEPLQIATYEAEDAGFYGWHVDTGAGRLRNRKLSIIVPLSEPTEYEGGDFDVFYDHEPSRIEMPLGRMVAFPSFLLHRVTPITRGRRRSLAVWIAGPPFR